MALSNQVCLKLSKKRNARIPEFDRRFLLALPTLVVLNYCLNKLTEIPLSERFMFMDSRIQITATLHELARVLSWLRSHLEKTGLQKKEILRLELVLEEAFVNAVQHAYREKEGIVEIEFRYIPKALVEFVITDFGPPFNPLKEAPKVDITKPIEEREVGGLGIYLMQHCIDDVQYVRANSSNILRFTKKLV